MHAAALVQADRRLVLPMTICAYASLAASFAPQAYANVLLHYAYQIFLLPFGLVIGLAIGGVLVSPSRRRVGRVGWCAATGCVCSW